MLGDLFQPQPASVPEHLDACPHCPQERSFVRGKLFQKNHHLYRNFDHSNNHQGHRYLFLFRNPKPHSKESWCLPSASASACMSAYTPRRLPVASTLCSARRSVPHVSRTRVLDSVGPTAAAFLRAVLQSCNARSRLLEQRPSGSEPLLERVAEGIGPYVAVTEADFQRVNPHPQGGLSHRKCVHKPLRPALPVPPRHVTTSAPACSALKGSAKR